MSVSDDSKMRLIETNFQILYAICKQIKDKEFQKTLSLIELKHNNQDIYELINKYNKSSLKTNFSAEDIYKDICLSLKDKCINVLQLITGDDVDTDHITDHEIQELLSAKLDVLSAQLIETEEMSKCVDTKFLNYQNLFGEYVENVSKYYSKYKIPFKLSYDELVSTLNMSKAQTLCIRNRMIETENILQKYGNKETIDKLKAERKALEAEEYQLKNELKKSENLLSEYESLDKDLLKEYKRVKSDLECRVWAVNELNNSAGEATD
ncbi:unnamed protein product [Medioppia subpectinata]|uniref:Uncharacterized protein n=1 Tax=Medioppia subpectinata TaxID=1979941 RepID=A0A7R9Q818_9ACAR|nr:unnamed protein product [Medioppia subpectinata]CAG2116421.1 unnamed protein product [Medioppia subpectinata]